jgi:hypothetical protein
VLTTTGARVCDFMARELEVGNCEHCHGQFSYHLVHAGFSDCIYAYCNFCGKTAILSVYDERMPKLPNCPDFEEICSAMEPYIRSCECGGRFQRGAAPRFPRCGESLSAESATRYIESNAPGTKVGWHWQRSWSKVYCIVIENKKVENNFR